MSFSIIISYYQNINMLKNCIHSLISTLQGEQNVEILIINDNPDIDLVSQLSATSCPLSLRVIQLPANRGHSGACAVGVDNSEGKYLIFLDSDIIVSANWFSELKKTFFEHPDCGAVTSTILDFSNNQIVYFGMELFKSETIKPFQGATRQNSYVFQDRLSQIVTSGCMLISRETYIESGGFDETFYNSCNDLDLSMKLNSAGYKNYISANSIVYHRGNVSGEVRFASHIYARSLFFQKWSKEIESDNSNSLSVLQDIYARQEALCGDYLIIDFSSSIFSDSYLDCIYKAKNIAAVNKYRIRNSSPKFGAALGNLGDSVLTFSTKVADIDNDSVKTAAEATKSIAEALTVENPDTNLGTFLQGSAIGLTVFVNKMDELDTYGASAKLTNLAAVGEKIQNGGFDGFNNLSEALTNAALEGVQAYADAFSDTDCAAQNAVSDFAKKSASGIESAKPKFTEVGLMMTKGFAEGMTSGKDYLNSAAANLAKEALETLRRVLDIHSPSKETFKMGSWFDAGFADGILNNSGQVEDAGATVGEKAKSGLNGVISKITDYIGGKIDVQPTITPVLDLSSVETQSKSIDAMFSREQAISVNAGIAANTASSSTTSSSSSNFTFTQNITSPKAVDAKTIYRQTRNQFSRMMGAIRQV